MAKRVELWRVEGATKGIGRTYPQIEDMIGGNWGDGKNSVYQLIGWRELPPKRPQFGTLPLARGARLTDVLSAAPISGPGLLVSERVVKLLANFDLGERGVYPAEVKADGKRYRYSWVQIVNDVTRRIDFAQSEFGDETGPYDRKRSKSLCIASVTELRKQHKRLIGVGGHALVPKDVVLRGSERDYLDLLRFGFDIDLYASARLKDALEAAEVTGLDFQPARVRFSS